ncbi:restriction endonuclease subunit S [Bifidobacterium bifidum]|uniref:restriction endonuclease subunit S n=1 Tax=Bifidobacterium bifidum TaxID=1681 RepID=UPI001105D6F0|nr:restriction endonuclease subunit S [Bifidobacterium bifidum]MDB1207760.1 restriction endonuclease subunit S [Bifidobacterium bifidum]
MTEQAKVPSIRFAGFTDPWEQRKLGEVAPLQRGFDLPVNQMTPGPYPVVMSNGIGGWHSKYMVKGPGVVTGRSGTIGSLHYIEQNFWPHNTSLWVTSFNGNEPRFIYWLYASIGLERFGSGSGVPTLNRNDVHDLRVGFPCDVAEQRRIGTFFSRLDSLITLHQRKYDKLVVFKKSMLEKMFPKDGESVPEIRFAGFTDPWEQRKLGDVATFGGGHTPSMADPDNYEDGYVLWVTSQDVKSNYLDRTTTQITEKGAKELTLYPAGSLVMVTRSGILRHTLPVAELRKPSTVNQDIRVILPQGECCGEWLLQFFISHNKELLLEFGKTGTTVESVDFGKIKDMLLYMPSTVEQQQIGDYFAKLDNLITLHQRKLELLRNIKKSLLDKMFV